MALTLPCSNFPNSGEPGATHWYYEPERRALYVVRVDWWSSHHVTINDGKQTKTVLRTSLISTQLAELLQAERQAVVYADLRR